MRAKNLLTTILFLTSIASIEADIPYFSNLTVEDAVATQNIESAKELKGIGPHLIEIDNSPLIGSNVVLRAHYFKAENPKALVLGVHGLQSNGRWFMRTGTHLAKQGISLMVYDRRGSGLSDGIKPMARIFFLGLLDNFDPNYKAPGVEGLRGHVNTSNIGLRRLVLNASKEFMSDIRVSYDKLKDLNEDYRNEKGDKLDIHVLANCFGSRIAIPFADDPGLFRSVKSLIVTAPATDMRPDADVTSLYKKVDIATPIIHFIGPTDYTSTPLKDALFVSPSNPAYNSIANDKVSLSLRYGTGDFFYATSKLNKKMEKAIGRLKTPMLVVLGNQDKMVYNDRIRNRFASQYRGPGALLTFNSEHMLEFTPTAGQGFAEATARWVLSDASTNDPTGFNTAGLKGLVGSVEKFGAASAEGRDRIQTAESAEAQKKPKSRIKGHPAR